MLFFLQMKWNIAGRLSFDEIWKLEVEEAVAAQGHFKVLSMYKVAGQQRVIAIVEVESADELDRTILGRLPLREYLDFEAIWPVRTFEAFVEDCKTGFGEVASDSARNQKKRGCTVKIHKSIYGMVVTFCIGTLALYCASTRTAVQASNDNDASTQAKIASAISAGPEDITGDATIAEMDAKGNMTVIRKGTNEWTCMPGDPNRIADPPMCQDKASMQWDYAFRRHLPKPLNTVPGITYMLAGAEQRSDSDPYDKISPPIKIGPHWMIMWPFDPKLTGLPTKHKAAGAYIMWAGSPYAHVHVMGRP